MDVWKNIVWIPRLLRDLTYSVADTANSIFKTHMNLCSFNWRKLRNQFEKTTVIGSWSRARIYDHHHHHPPDEGMNNGPWILIYPMGGKIVDAYLTKFVIQRFYSNEWVLLLPGILQVVIYIFPSSLSDSHFFFF